MTDPWRVDTDGDGISDSVEVNGWKRTSPGIVPDPEGFRTDPLREDTDRDGFEDEEDLDPLHDLMISLTVGEYEALDADPDLDDPYICFVILICFRPWPEPFVEVEYQGESFYTPHQDPAGMSVDFDKVYTLDVSDDTATVGLTLRAWDDDIVADKQWDLDNSSTALEAVISFNLLDETTGDTEVTGADSDGDESTCGTVIPGPDPNACRDARLTYRIDTVRLGRINTILVDSLDTDDLLETASGDLRYLGDSVFYIAWIDATSSAGPFEQGLNAVLVPRAQFFNSSVNHTLQTTEDPGNLPAYLKDLAFTVFNESAEETTHAIAGVLNGTLSGTAANLLLQDLIRGPDAVVNGDWTAVTEQFVTLGLPDRVVNAVPLEGIRFDAATGEGPGDIFSDFLDFLLDAAAFVVQGLVLIGTAIAAFFAQAAAFLVELGMAVLGAIGAFLGQVRAALEIVQESFLDFISSFIEFLKGFVTSFLDATLRPLVESIEGYLSGIQLAFGQGVDEFLETGTVSTPTGQRMMGAILSPFFSAILLIVTALIVAVIALTTTVPVMALVLGVLPSIILISILPLLGVSAETPASSVDVDGVELSSGAIFDATLGLVSATGITSDILDFMSFAFGGMSLLMNAKIVDFLLEKGIKDVTGVLWLALAITVAVTGIILSVLVLSTPEPLRGLAEDAFAFMGLMLGILGLVITLLYFVKFRVRVPQIVPMVQLSALFALVGISLGFLALVV